MLKFDIAQESIIINYNENQSGFFNLNYIKSIQNATKVKS